MKKKWNFNKRKRRRISSSFCRLVWYRERESVEKREPTHVSRKNHNCIKTSFFTLSHYYFTKKALKSALKAFINYFFYHEKRFADILWRCCVCVCSSLVSSSERSSSLVSSFFLPPLHCWDLAFSFPPMYTFSSYPFLLRLNLVWVKLYWMKIRKNLLKSCLCSSLFETPTVNLKKALFFI